MDYSVVRCRSFFFFFFNDTATTEIYTLSLHDALPISPERASSSRYPSRSRRCTRSGRSTHRAPARRSFLYDAGDRKSTRLNSSHLVISYAVFCLKKKKNKILANKKTYLSCGQEIHSHA